MPKVPWNKGLKATPEAIHNQSVSHMGQVHPPFSEEVISKIKEARARQIPPTLGKKYSQQAKTNMSIAQQKRTKWELHTEEAKQKMGVTMTASWNKRRGFVPTGSRDVGLRKKFGITEVQYWEMHKAQGGVCSICGKPEKGKMLSVDHDHVTGQVRGLLCWKCNAAIGHLGDSEPLLKRAWDYIRGKK